ncbi:uncharacterized protein MELLADRAFT_70820 [Melampsora larici-populina 98AG31]|uniref:Ribosomal RNA-processing protein 43 n=1 Tax=Melampsora larici-populina (strain 98AG31 / pathotype 3-4-7) TaxID=747676 RepID=F4R8B1_MELLP|nr:uncharacterized protein MELLADRAFT_70820 [Melampsora larici-populina 98AG31]EGG11458.1 hypothetical protein MELLADRAFT_70820 [Melampsora larici-populina 98AG31]
MNKLKMKSKDPLASSQETSKLNEFDIENYKRLQPINYLKQMIKENKRSDLIRSSVRQIRLIKINNNSISTSNGSSLVSIGNTSVLCGIRFEVSEPNFMNPNQGYIIPNIEIGSLCSSKFKPNQINEQSQTILTQLKMILKSSEIIEPSSLVIQPEKLVWVIYIDVICLSNDGNVLDASIISITQALQTAKRPQVEFDIETNEVILLDPNFFEPIPIPLNHTIHPFTFSIFEKREWLVDPTLFEEDHSKGSVTVVLDSKKKLRYLLVSGEVQQGSGVLNDCLQFSFNNLNINS